MWLIDVMGSAAQDEKRGERQGCINDHPCHVGIRVVDRPTGFQEDTDEVDHAATDHVDHCDPHEGCRVGVMLKELDAQPDHEGSEDYRPGCQSSSHLDALMRVERCGDR